MADPMASPGRPPRLRRLEGAIGGALAGAVALLVLLGGSAAGGSNGFLEAARDGLTRYIPLPLFDAAIGALGPYAKGLLAIAVAVGVVVVGAVLGALLVRTRTVSGRSGPADALLVALLAWLLAEAVALPLLGAGFFGTSLDVDPIAFHGPLMLASLAYGLVLVGIARDGRPAEAVPDAGAPVAAVPPESPSAGLPAFGRRTFLGRGLVLVGLGSIGASGVSLVSRVLAAGSSGAAVRPVVPGDAFGPTPALTPLDQFYVVAKDLGTPQVDAASWRLTVGGLVDRPTSYTLDQLRTLPSVEGYRTLQCISNEVVTYGRYIGNQRWKGIRASDVIDPAGVASAARFVLWRSADGYTESIPLDVARDERTWLAYEMGPPGTPLPAEHGFPLRVLIAGRYGMKQPKFLTDIVLADHDEPGFWEERGWDETAAVRTYSRIDLPRDGDEVPAGAAFPVYGVASSGDRGISRVEVSPDGGSTWQDATLEPDGGPIGDLTWVRWRAEVTVATPGRVDLLARATDGRGNLQDATPRGALPSGATGLMRVTVTALAG